MKGAANGRTAAAAAGLTLLLSSALAPAALAQAWISQPPPIRTFVDANGVDLSSGLVTLSFTDVTIGQGVGAMAYVRSFIGNGWTDNLVGTISVSGSTYSVSFGAASESFTLSNGVFTPAQGQGSSLSYNAAAGTYTYTTGDDTAVTFQTALAGQYPAYAIARPTTAVHPNGLTLAYTYQTVKVPTGCTSSCTSSSRLSSVNNNAGYQLKLAYQSNTANAVADLAAWTTIANVTGINNAVDWCDPTANSCSAFSITWPSMTYTASTATDALGRTTTFTIDGYGRMYSIQSPVAATAPIIYGYQPNGASYVKSVTNGGQTWSYSFSQPPNGPQTVTVTDPLGRNRVVVANLVVPYLLPPLVTSDTDGANETTSYAYYPTGQLQTVTLPEGNAIGYVYDGRGNLTTLTKTTKPGSNLSPITASWGFDPRCAQPAKCNEPNSATDFNDNTTQYTYDPKSGLLTSTTYPAPTQGAVQPQTRYGYTAEHAWYKISATQIAQAASPIQMLTGTSACQRTTSCVSPETSDELKQTISYLPGSASQPTNLQVASVSAGAGDGSLTAAEAITYDGVGNLLTVQGPLGVAQTRRYRYDFERQLTGFVAPNPGAGENLADPAIRYTYAADGQPTLIERGTVASQSDADWTNFSSLESRILSYDGAGRKAWEVFSGGGVYMSMVQYGYDAANELQCVAVRMNHANFGDGSTPACALGTPGTSAPDNLPDQISFLGYDAAGRLDQVTRGYGTAAQSLYAAYTYWPNGNLQTVLDGANNLSRYVWDGFDRQSETEFPLPPVGSGQIDQTNFEDYTWDNNGNQTEIRLRDGQDISYQYDALNRLTFKDSPAGYDSDVYYSYDNLNRLLYAHFDAPTGPGVDFAWDALGRRVSETASGRTIAYQYDLAGDRTRITWPDAAPNALYVAYLYDLLGRVTQVEENGHTSGVGLLGQYTYDNLGRLTRIDRAGGSGASTLANYTRAGFISSLTQNFAGSSNDVNWAPSYSYSPSAQMIGNVATNDAYSYHPTSPAAAGYSANALNQYAKVHGTSFAYDSRGNLTSDGARSFTYDPENRLLTASGSGIAGVSLSYDPVGRLRTSASGGATKTLLYSGEDLVGEYDSSGAILARTVPGPGVDEPVAWYQGPGTANRQWPHMDMQGSIVAWSNATGAPVGSQGYDPYGQPANWSAGNRYAYTGQIMIPEAHLYSFKARMYDPGLGRFLQTDPIGQASDVNLYAYVGNDPVNGWDPSGMATQVEEFVVQGKIIKCVNGCTSLDVVMAVYAAAGRDFPSYIGADGPTAQSHPARTPQEHKACQAAIDAAAGTASNLPFLLDPTNTGAINYEVARYQAAAPGEVYGGIAFTAATTLFSQSGVLQAFGALGKLTAGIIESRPLAAAVGSDLGTQGLSQMLGPSAQARVQALQNLKALVAACSS